MKRTGWLGIFVPAFVVVPGIFPLIGDWLVKMGLISLPSYVNPEIFNRFLVLFYVVEVPKFLLLFLYAKKVILFVFLGAIIPWVVFFLLSMMIPIPTIEEELLARAIFKYCTPFILVFGALDGLLFWITLQLVRKSQD